MPPVTWPRPQGILGSGSAYLFVPLAGDYNFNGEVEAGDYTVWANSFGQTGVGLPADGNFNGEVEAGDYIVWANNFGMTASAPLATAQAVPEPSAFLLAIVGIIGLFCYRRRRRR